MKRFRNLRVVCLFLRNALFHRIQTSSELNHPGVLLTDTKYSHHAWGSTSAKMEIQHHLGYKLKPVVFLLPFLFGFLFVCLFVCLFVFFPLLCFVPF